MDKREFLAQKRDDILVFSILTITFRALFILLFFATSWMACGNWLLGILGFLFPIATVFGFSVVHCGFLSSTNVWIIFFLFVFTWSIDVAIPSAFINACISKYYSTPSYRGGSNPP